MTFSAAEEPKDAIVPLAKPKPGRSRRKIKSSSKARVTVSARNTKAHHPRPGCKTARVLALLRGPQGVGLKELLKTTGWQPHSVRGFLSGVVAKRMGLKVRSTKAGAAERRYRIIP